ncbi:MAG: HEPN domain-containing protein [Desulfurococcaceae archaeon]
MQRRYTPTRQLKRPLRPSSTTSMRPPWGRSVRLLQRYFVATGSSPPNDLTICARELGRYYIPLRNAHPAVTPHEAYDEEASQRAVECAKRVVEYAKEVVLGRTE